MTVSTLPHPARLSNQGNPAAMFYFPKVRFSLRTPRLGGTPPWTGQMLP